MKELKNAEHALSMATANVRLADQKAVTSQDYAAVARAWADIAYSELYLLDLKTNSMNYIEENDDKEA